MSTKSTETTRRVSLYLPPDLHRRLKVRAAETDTSASTLVARYVREGLLRDRPEAGPPPLPGSWAGKRKYTGR